MDLIEIYNLLSNFYGRQNWWPVVQENGDCIYKEEYLYRERTSEEIFEIIAGAILTQNTNWNNVVKAIFNLKQANVLSVNKILNMDLEELANLIKPSGFYSQKAKKLKVVAKFIESAGGIDFLRNFPLKELREKLLSLWGIGYETADSILLYGFNHPVFVVDAYTKRIFFRLGFLERNSSYEDVRIFFEKNLPDDVIIYKEFHALIVEFGKNLCKKIPLCRNCFLSDRCKNFAQ